MTYNFNLHETGVPLLFWLILFIKRRHGVADTLLLLEDPSNVEQKERLLIELRRDLVDRGKKIDEDQLQLFQSEMMAEFLRDRKLQV
jgi:hydroxyacyl-ACP dehydratase HTD2-like protein with hotdog domain